MHATFDPFAKGIRNSVATTNDTCITMYRRFRFHLFLKFGWLQRVFLEFCYIIKVIGVSRSMSGMRNTKTGMGEDEKT